MINNERFTLVGYNPSSTTGEARSVTFPRAARWRRAAAAAAVSWGVALISVFIPVAHFLLVPGFFLAGGIGFVMRLRTPDLIESMTGRCPDCGTSQEFEAGGRWNLPRSVRCAHCHRTLTARPKP